VSTLDFQFYSHNGDSRLAKKLGLADESKWRRTEGSWIELGTVTVDLSPAEAATVRVEVAPMPAQFWRFSIIRPGGDKINLSTGSGGLGKYWPAAHVFAREGMSASARFQDLIDDDCLGIKGDWLAGVNVEPLGPRARLSPLANPSFE
jgi:hypothetical protein